MKRFLAISLAISLIFALSAFSVSAAVTTTDLLPESVDDFVKSAALSTNFGVVKAGNGYKLTTDDSYPHVAYTFDEPLVVDPDDYTVNLDFNLVTGATSIRVKCVKDPAAEINEENIQYIYLNHYLFDNTQAGYGDNYDTAGDIKIAGQYEFSAKLSDLKAYAGTPADVYLARKDLVLTDEKLTIIGIDLFTVGANAEVTFNKLNLTTGEEDVSDTSSGTTDTSSVIEGSSSEASVSNTSSTSTSSTSPTTGDFGIAAIIVIAVITCAGVYMVKKAR